MIGIGDMNLTIRNRNRKLFYEMLSTSSSPKTNNFVNELYFTHCPHFRLNSPNKTQYSVIDHWLNEMFQAPWKYFRNVYEHSQICEKTHFRLLRNLVKITNLWSLILFVQVGDKIFVQSSGFGLVLNREVELELGRQLVFRIQSVRKVNASNTAIRVNLKVLI